jgi:hypothetical protein
MKKPILIFLITSILLNIWLVYKYKEVRTSLNNCNETWLNNNSLITKLIKSQILQFKYNGKVFKGERFILDSLRKVVGRKPKLFLSFNEFSCESCVDLALNELKIIGQKIGNENVVILTKYENNREALFLRKRLGDKFKIFNITSEQNLFLGENYFSLLPNFFILDDKLVSNFFFSHSINFPSLNEGYYNFIESYFNNFKEEER